jgi:GNAT superfamily N-acetyltransferase
MIRSAGLDDLPRIQELLARANDAPYDLVRVSEEKCFGAGVAGAPEVRVWGDFAGVSVTCGRWLRILAVDRAQRGRGIGTALLRDAEERGATIIAAEAGNYFTPGVMEPGFFEKRGYAVTVETQNLVTTELPRESVLRPTANGPRPTVLAFVRKHFGEIWSFEAARGRLFHIERNGDVAGFAAHDANNQGLGFFGPAGVAPEHRGHGFGSALLLACLADARTLGYERVIIPWADAVDFYVKACGARVAHRFFVLRKG